MKSPKHAWYMCIPVRIMCVSVLTANSTVYVEIENLVEQVIHMYIELMNPLISH